MIPARRRSLVFAACALLLYAIPLALIVWTRWSTNEQLRAIAPPPGPIDARASLMTYRDRQAVTVVPTFSAMDEVLAPAWAGVVTQMPIESGDELTPGQLVAQVDGIDRLAYTSPRPLFRPLAAGASATDVSDLVGVLHSLGYLASTSPRSYDTTVESAVRRLANAIRAPADGSTFDPGWLVWLPRAPFPIKEVHAKTAGVAPASGNPLFTAPPRLRSVSFETERGAPDLTGAWLLEVDGATASLVDGALDAEGLAALSKVASLTDQQPLTGQVMRAHPREAVTIAASAITSGQRDVICVWTPSADGHQPYRSHRVTLGAATTSGVEVVKGMKAGDVYLVNPAETVDTGRCQ